MQPNKLVVLKDTVWKSRPVPSADLEKEERANLKGGTTFTILASAEAPLGHVKVTLGENLSVGGRNTGFIFKGHAQLLREEANKISLGVPFFSQVARQGEPSSLPVQMQNRICNSSSCAMVAKFLGAKISGDEAYLKIVEEFGDTTDHNAQGLALNEIDIESQWNTNLDFGDLDASIEAGLPVVMGILHRGTDWNPTGGHMATCIGYVDVGGVRCYIFNDPFGSLNDGYTGSVENGEGVIYSREELSLRWTADGKKTGWGRTFYGNN